MPLINEESLAMVLGRLTIARGDQAAWQTLYNQTWPFVVAVAGRRLGGMVSLAEDVAQDVFVRLLRYARFADFQDAEHFKRYLVTVTNHVCDDELRRWKARVQSSEGIKARPEPLGRDPDPERQAEGREMAAKIAACLTAKERLLLRLVVEGYDLAEIAAIAKLSYSAAATRISRARDKVRKALERNDL